MTGITYIKQWTSPHDMQQWHFLQCDVENLPDSWDFFTHDDGGHLFSFFWHPVAERPSGEWHPVFQSALAEIRNMVKHAP